MERGSRGCVDWPGFGFVAGWTSEDHASHPPVLPYAGLGKGRGPTPSGSHFHRHTDGEHFASLTPASEWTENVTWDSDFRDACDNPIQAVWPCFTPRMACVCSLGHIVIIETAMPCEQDSEAPEDKPLGTFEGVFRDKTHCE